jgi:hypothetical protein
LDGGTKRRTGTRSEPGMDLDVWFGTRRSARARGDTGEGVGSSRGLNSGTRGRPGTGGEPGVSLDRDSGLESGTGTGSKSGRSVGGLGDERWAKIDKRRECLGAVATCRDPGVADDDRTGRAGTFFDLNSRTESRPGTGSKSG